MTKSISNNNEKCSSNEHDQTDAIYFCKICNIYMCNKCENFHSKLFKNNHNHYKLDQDIKKLFTGICKEDNHPNKLDYFCLTHNKLVCVACISKMKNKGNGQHSNCQVCTIEEIKNDKKSNLIVNINNLEYESKIINRNIDKLKKIFEDMKDKKESLKLYIQKLFTQIRNTLNEREARLLELVDKKCDNLFFDESLIIESESLPKEISISIEKAKKINNDWDDENKLSSLINICLDIENHIEEINKLNNNINIYSQIPSTIKFYPAQNKIDLFLESIKSFGNIISDDRIVDKNKINIDEKENKKILDEDGFEIIGLKKRKPKKNKQ